MKAVLRNYEQAVRKVRLVANLVRGKRADEALLLLTYTPRKASRAIRKLIESALANAGASRQEAGAFRIARIAVDKGIVLRRYMPRARGMASPIRRERSHITLELAPVEAQPRSGKGTQKEQERKETHKERATGAPEETSAEAGATTRQATTSRRRASRKRSPKEDATTS